MCLRFSIAFYMKKNAVFVDICWLLKSVYCKIDPFLNFDCHRKPFTIVCAIEVKNVRDNTRKRNQLAHSHIHTRASICSKYHNLFWLLSCGDSHSFCASITLLYFNLISLRIHRLTMCSVFAHFCIWGLLPQHNFIFSRYMARIHSVFANTFCCRQQQRMKIAHHSLSRSRSFTSQPIYYLVYHVYLDHKKELLTIICRGWFSI